MGGLLGKTIIKKLQDEGEENLIESFVMVGTPQLGTPQAISSILHGDGGSLGVGFITNPIGIRRIAQNMPSAYSLLPSQKYFESVPDPVISFSADTSFTQTWIDLWGTFINNYSSYFSFMTGSNMSRVKPVESDLLKPEVLRTDLLTHAQDFHNIYDNYQFPENIRVIEVAGWGVPTVKSIEYIMRHGVQSYKTNFTVEGDKTVVYASAISSTTNEQYFFNLFESNDIFNTEFQHRDLLNSIAIKNLLSSVFKKENIIEKDFISNIKPTWDLIPDQLIVSTHSPVILGAYDQFGNFTGIDSNQDLSQEMLSFSENIPGSSFIYNNDGQYIFLPKEGAYNFIYKGTGDGLTTVYIENFVNDITAPIVSYTDIPTTSNTNTTFTVEGIAPENTTITIDENGDGQVDENLHHDEYVFSLEELIVILKDKIYKLNTQESIKKDLSKKVEKLEKKISKNKEKFENKQILKTLSKMTTSIIKRSMKEKIENKEAQELIDLINKIENML
jgi:hypothetical protein